jgi:hypothetical protein
MMTKQRQPAGPAMTLGNMLAELSAEGTICFSSF